MTPMEDAENDQSHDLPEHQCLGETGSKLAAIVWDREDFSDWELDASDASQVFGS